MIFTLLSKNGFIFVSGSYGGDDDDDDSCMTYGPLGFPLLICASFSLYKLF